MVPWGMIVSQLCKIDMGSILLQSQAFHTFDQVTVQLKAWLIDCKPVRVSLTHCADQHGQSTPADRYAVCASQVYSM